MLEWGGVGAIAFVLAYYISNNKTKIAFPVTVGTMLATVLVGYLGLSRARLGGLERQVDLLAGLTVAASGAKLSPE